MQGSRPAPTSGRSAASRATGALVAVAVALSVVALVACEERTPDVNHVRHAESYGRVVAEDVVVIARDLLLRDPDHPRQRAAREQLLYLQTGEGLSDEDVEE